MLCTRTRLPFVSPSALLSLALILTFLQIVGYLAAGIILATSSINSLIYSSRGAEEAVAAGFILLAIVSVSTTTE